MIDFDYQIDDRVSHNMIPFGSQCETNELSESFVIPIQHWKLCAYQCQSLENLK
jgi:hypothetical protein